MKSASRNASVNLVSLLIENSSSRSTLAPDGIVPEVGTPWVIFSAWPSAKIPPEMIEP